MKILRWLFRVSAPILILEYFVLYFVARNLHENLTAYDVAPPLIIAAALGALLIGVFRLFIKSLDRAVLAAAAWAIFIFYVPLYEALLYEMQLPIRHRYLLPAFAVIMIGVPILARRLREGMLLTVHKVVTYMSMVLVAMTLYPITTYATKEAKTRLTNEQVIEFVYPEGESPYEFEIDTTKNPLGYYPDIYYIIPDGYARDDVFISMYNYDNTNFTTYLSKCGFFIATESRSNYDMTYLSIPSSMNMTYIANDVFESGHFPNRNSDYKILDILYELGYTFYDVTAHARHVIPKTDMRDTRITSYHLLLIEHTPVSFAKAIIKNDIALYNKRVLTDAEYTTINHAIALPGPKFVMFHTTSTHVPFASSAVGGPPNDISEKSKYIEIITYTNNKIKNLIVNILNYYSDFGQSPIIILQSDHGPRTPQLIANRNDPTLQDTSLLLLDRIGILNAYYFPSVDNSILYNSITPINTFRVLLREYFGGNMELLPDKTFCRYHAYIDVTSMPDFGPFVEIRGDSAVYFTENREVKSVFRFPKQETTGANLN